VYDTLPWYWKAVGEDYEPALMVTRMTNAVAARMADDLILPLRPGRYLPEMRRALEGVRARAIEKKIDAPDLLGEGGAIAALAGDVRSLEEHEAVERFSAGEVDRLGPEGIARVNRWLVECDRLWLDARGLPNRPWFRSAWAASDEDSGYAAWTLPLARPAIEEKDPAALARALGYYRARAVELSRLWGGIRAFVADAGADHDPHLELLRPQK
jgi:N-acetylated-alpha-linked acidic dipeptidase